MITINLAKRFNNILIPIFFVRLVFMGTIKLGKRFKNILIAPFCSSRFREYFDLYFFCSSGFYEYY